MEEVIELLSWLVKGSMSGGIMKFLGSYIILHCILSIPLTFVLSLINTLLKHWNIRKYGWPRGYKPEDAKVKDK